MCLCPLQKLPGSKYFVILKILFTFEATNLQLREIGSSYTQKFPYASHAYVHVQVGNLFPFNPPDFSYKPINDLAVIFNTPGTLLTQQLSQCHI
jgi:hypothetical protein